MTRTHRIYVGILGLAISSLAVDMLFLQSEPTAAFGVETIALAPPAMLAPDEVDEPSLAEILATFVAAAPATDEFFSVPQAWLPTEAEQGPEQHYQTIPSLTLTNTLADVAQINGQAIRVGSFVDREKTVRLVRIENVGMRIEDVGRAPSAIVEFSGVLYRLRAGADKPVALKLAEPAENAG